MGFSLATIVSAIVNFNGGQTGTLALSAIGVSFLALTFVANLLLDQNRR